MASVQLYGIVAAFGCKIYRPNSPLICETQPFTRSSVLSSSLSSSNGSPMNLSSLWACSKAFFQLLCKRDNTIRSCCEEQILKGKNTACMYIDISKTIVGSRHFSENMLIVMLFQLRLRHKEWVFHDIPRWSRYCTQPRFLKTPLVWFTDPLLPDKHPILPMSSV